MSQSHSVRIHDPNHSSPITARRRNNNNNNINTRHRREISPSAPEAVPLVPVNRPPLAESEDTDDDREEVSKPYPGVDDGFFDSNNKPSANDPENPDVETINPKRPEGDDDDKDNDDDDDKIPDLTPRAGGDGDSVKPDEVDTGAGGLKPGVQAPQPGFNGRFPYAPGFGPGSIADPELGVGIGGLDLDSIPDVNVYQHKKTLAQGMMDLALFSANANQLRYVLESSSKHPYFYPSLAMISISLILQVAVGIGLIWNALYNVKDDRQICIANKINNFTVIGIFLVTVINVFVSAFGVAAPAAVVT